MTNNQNMGRVAGKAAWVTGGGSGIGRATAIALAAEGARVAVTDIDGEKAHKTAVEMRKKGYSTLSFQLDVTDENQWQKGIELVLTEWGQLDILVNNAGISVAQSITDMNLAQWRQVMSVNLDGVFLGTKYGIIGMKRGKGGSIINVSSASGFKAAPGASAYSTSKAGVRLFSKCAALEAAQTEPRIRVNTVLPGGVMTPMWSSMEGWEIWKEQAGTEAELWNKLAENTPLKRFAKPEEIALAILYLASDESQFVTGAELVIDGGFTA
ncbi:glucose 1-dehydrogenase [Phormidium pseudopriestleyi FRX01]|uniref:Glucose 1-dehydrogenase n=1 Tax=Phormidium pseudopriestleyi FRX01 TaxID=1759528 RepID=A0ABS3FY87_9CYAN|nr:glucose 1-dehydrogenase [Phormidium pseudopriestleyi]MBO0351797.1 glucose 1-dehydrogenase [Phormidium pseudopriestleyi FRX01]